MRNIKNKLLIGFLIVFSVLSLSACTNENTEPTEQDDLALSSIEIDMDTVLPSYELGEFNPGDIVLILYFEGDFTTMVKLAESMITTDLSILEDAGTHTLSVKYSNQTTTFDVVISEGLVFEDISINIGTYNPYALIDTFVLSNIKLDVSMSDDTIRLIQINESMISSRDLAKLEVEGVHDITVNYEGLVTSFRIAMFDTFPVFEEESSLQESIFYEVMNMLMVNHYTNPSEELLFEGALQGMIDVLDDPFTNYFDAEAAAQYQTGFEETYVGIGVRVQYIDGNITVEGVINGGAAEEEGIMVGDIIRTVDGMSVAGMNLYEAVNYIIGEEGTFVDVGVERAGVTHLIIFHLERRVIDNPTVVAEVIMHNGSPYGLITVNSFGNETADLFSTALTDLEAQNIEGLIIDLRNNGGGRLDTVLSMMRQLLVQNQEPIFSLEYLSGGEAVFQSLYGGLTTQRSYDIVTLINGGSASASEVFASGMQEQGNYTVVGTTSFGKGTMQQTMRVSVTEGDYINITIGKWLTSEDNWVHFNGGTSGVTPDIVSALEPIEYAWKIYLQEGESFLYDTVSPRVANMQIILNAMGYTVRTDGYYDLATQSAIEDIQTTAGLTITGNVDQDTMIIINDFLRSYQNNRDNDSQLKTALDYFN